MTESEEKVNRPKHYLVGGSVYEVIKVQQAWGLLDSYHLSCAVKYIARCRHKGNEVEDIQKAIWYLQDYLERIHDVSG